MDYKNARPLKVAAVAPNFAAEYGGNNIMAIAKTLGKRVLQRAIDKAGSIERAAQFLGITPGALAAYKDGRRDVPEALFMRLVDLAMEESLPPGVPLARSRKPPADR